MFTMLPDSPKKSNGALTQSALEFLPNPNSSNLSRAKRWLADRLDRGHREVFSEENVLLTPELASLLLTLNSQNRNLRDSVVDTYAKDMLAGRWLFNGESMIVCSDDVLSSGQHRCHAVIRSGVTIPAILVFGVDPGSRISVDTGFVKTAGDHLHGAGIQNGNNLAAAATRVLGYNLCGRMPMGVERPTKQECIEFVRQTPDLAESLRFVNRDKSGKIAALSFLCTAHFLLARVDRADADSFMEGLITGENLARSSPIYVLREKLLAKDRRLTDNERMKAVFAAWNNWRAGRSVRTLVHNMTRGERLPDLR